MLKPMTVVEFLSKGPKVHELKTWPEFFRAVQRREKLFELRKDDRGFHLGDTLILREWEPNSQEYSGASIEATVTYILDQSDFGVRRGYVAMGIKIIREIAG